MKIKVWVRHNSYEGTQVLNENDYQEVRAKGIKARIADEVEFGEWLNSYYAPIEVYDTPKESILQAWREACEVDWEDNEEDKWESFTIEV